MAILLLTIVDRVVTVIHVEQGVDKIGGNLLDEIQAAFVQGDLVCCMTPWDFCEAIESCQENSRLQRCWRKTSMTSMYNYEVSGLPTK